MPENTPGAGFHYGELNPGQRAAVDAIVDGRNVFLTGGAGCGKSAAVSVAVSRLAGRGVKPLLCASTGKAAADIGGTTLHSAFRLKTAKLTVYGQQDKPWRDPGEPSVLESADLVIIDEVSMIRCDLFDLVSEMMAEASVPQLVVVGDFFQLPPVTQQAEEAFMHDAYPDASDGFFAFEGRAWESWGFEFHNLDQNMRTSEGAYMALLNRVRVGDASAIPGFAGRVWEGPEPPRALTLAARNRKVDEYNRYFDAMLGNKRRRRFDAQVKGKVSHDRYGIEGFEESLTLKAGSRVIAVKNDRDSFYMNGSTGEVVGFTKAGVAVRFDGTGETVDVDPVYHEIEEYCMMPDKSDPKYLEARRQGWFAEFDDLGGPDMGYPSIPLTAKRPDVELKLGKHVCGSVTQVPLRLANSMTIHKSQGMSVDECSVDPDGCFAPGQLYVALSRCRRFDGLHLLSGLRPEHMIASQAVLDFYERNGAL